MPLLPIDLQTLFSQTNQVAREQAVQQQAAPQAQSVQGSLLVQQTEQRDNDVNPTEHQQEGPEQVKPRSGRREQVARRERGRKEKQQGKPAARREVLRDPELGRNIDVTG